MELCGAVIRSHDSSRQWTVLISLIWIFAFKYNSWKTPQKKILSVRLTSAIEVITAYHENLSIPSPGSCRALKVVDLFIQLVWMTHANCLVSSSYFCRWKCLAKHHGFNLALDRVDNLHWSIRMHCCHEAQLNGAFLLGREYNTSHWVSSSFTYCVLVEIN